MDINSEKITQAKSAGYSDAEIMDYLGQDKSLSSKITQARNAKYSDAEIIAHLAGEPSRPSVGRAMDMGRPAWTGEDAQSEAPAWASKHPNLYGAAGATWEVAKPAIELGVTGIGATPGLAAAAVNPVIGGTMALAGGGVGYSAAKQATRQVDKWLGAPSDMAPAPLTGLAEKAVGKLPQTVEDIASGAEYTAEGEVVPRAIRGVVDWAGNQARKMPARIINSLVKPLQKDFAYGKNPGRTVADEGIIANNFDDLIQKISAKRSEIGQKLGDISEMLTKNAKEKNLSVDLSEAFSPVREAIETARENPRTNSALITRLENLRDDLMKVEITSTGQPYATRRLKSLTFNDALTLKRDIGDLTKWTGNPSDDKVVNAALKKVYGAVKEELNATAEKVNPDAAGVYRKLNEKYADITSAEIAAKYRDKIMERRNIVSLPGHLMAIGGAVTAFVESGGSALPAILAGASGAALDKALGSTAVKTRLAAWLAKAAPEEVSAVAKAAPGLAAAIQRAFPQAVQQQLQAISKSGLPEKDKTRFINNLFKDGR